MKYVVVSDAHGNQPYFDIVFNEIDSIRYDGIIYLGDAFGYMNDGVYIFNELIRRNAVIVKGNHEAMLTGEIPIDDAKDKLYGLKRQKKILPHALQDAISRLPDSWQIATGDKKALFVHGAPYDFFNGYLYEDNTEYSWGEEQFDYIFMGHTHRPFVKQRGHTIYVNVGSMGLPRDKGLLPSYAFFDDKTGEIELKRVPIDGSVLESSYYSEIDERVVSVLRRK